MYCFLHPSHRVAAPLRHPHAVRCCPASSRPRLFMPRPVPRQCMRPCRRRPWPDARVLRQSMAGTPASPLTSQPRASSTPPSACAILCDLPVSSPTVRNEIRSSPPSTSPPCRLPPRPHPVCAPSGLALPWPSPAVRLHPAVPFHLCESNPLRVCACAHMQRVGCVCAVFSLCVCVVYTRACV
jgi:hypothetical protein